MMILPLARWHDHPSAVSVDDASILLNLMPEWKCWRREAVSYFLAQSLGVSEIELLGTKTIPKRIVTGMLMHTKLACQTCLRIKNPPPPMWGANVKRTSPLRAFSSEIFDALCGGLSVAMCWRCYRGYEEDSVSFLAKRLEKMAVRKGN